MSENTNSGTETLVVGGGCFWCIETQFRELKGVVSVESGYAGGQVPNPTYEAVCSGNTGHAEVIKIEFNPAEVSRAELLGLFLVLHDPTQLNRQGGDVGTQYRSVIFYTNEEEKAQAQAAIDKVNEAGIYDSRIVTTLEPLDDYYPAEEYHQRYLEKFESASFLEKMQMNAGYCQAIVAPKVAKFRKEYRDRLKAVPA